jgi:hypothetical protein
VARAKALERARRLERHDDALCVGEAGELGRELDLRDRGAGAPERGCGRFHRLGALRRRKRPLLGSADSDARRRRPRSWRERPGERLDEEGQVLHLAREETQRVERRASGFTPVSGVHPKVGFSPTTPQKEAGRMTEPAVCVPIAAGTMRAATAAADPLDEPPGVREGSRGLRVRPGA